MSSVKKHNISSKVDEILINIYTNIDNSNKPIPFTRGLFTEIPKNPYLSLNKYPYFTTKYRIPYESIKGLPFQDKINFLFNKKEFIKYVSNNEIKKDNFSNNEFSEYTIEIIDDNVKSLLKLLFPTSYPVKENCVDTYNELIAKTEPISNKFSSSFLGISSLLHNVFTSSSNTASDVEEHEQESNFNKFTYINIDGKIYTVLKVVYLNDFINNPKYNEIIGIHKEFNENNEIYKNIIDWKISNIELKICLNMLELFDGYCRGKNEKCKYFNLMVKDICKQIKYSRHKYRDYSIKDKNIESIKDEYFNEFNNFFFNDNTTYFQLKNILTKILKESENNKNYNNILSYMKLKYNYCEIEKKTTDELIEIIDNNKYSYTVNESEFTILLNEIKLESVKFNTKVNSYFQENKLTDEKNNDISKKISKSFKDTYNLIIRNKKISNEGNERKNYHQYQIKIKTLFEKYKIFIKKTKQFFLEVDKNNLNLPDFFIDKFSIIEQLYNEQKLLESVKNSYFQKNKLTDIEIPDKTKEYYQANYSQQQELKKIMEKFVYPNRESINDKLVEIILSYINQSNEPNEFNDILKKIEQDEHIDENLLMKIYTGVDLYNISKINTPKYEIQVYMDLIEGKLSNSILSKVGCYFKDNELINLYYNLKYASRLNNSYVFSNKLPILKIPRIESNTDEKDKKNNDISLVESKINKTGGKLRSTKRKYKNKIRKTRFIYNRCLQ